MKMINYNLLFWSLNHSILLQMVLARRRASSNVRRSLAIHFFFPLTELIGEAKKAKKAKTGFFFLIVSSPTLVRKKLNTW